MSSSVFDGVPGAITGERGIAHFGDPFREQRRLATGTAIAPLDDRTVIEVSGPERLPWLDSITSQAVSGLRAGESTELLVLDPQGRVEHAAGVLDDGISTWLLADAGDAEGLARWLTRMKFRTQATVELRPDLALLGFVDGGSAADRVRGLDGVRVWVDPWQRISVGGHQYAAVPSHPGADLAWRIGIVPETAARALAADPRPRGRRRGCSPPRPCGSPPGVRAGQPRSTSGRYRTSRTGSAVPCT
ncbi:hypothetical protein [Microbacterium sp. NRRL B-14842]|uniref:hypothetical protein n=1 Tax=Microbacterium sp. NRRL B-14842 TaxID=3162881 RepID=UPI003D2669F9